jgi:DNA-binding NarL/FixJ family response regulator
MHFQPILVGTCAGRRQPVPSLSCVEAVKRVQILSTNRVLAGLVRGSAALAFPRADVSIARTVAEVAVGMAHSPLDILVTDIVAEDGDVLAHLAQWLSRQCSVQHVLIMTEHREPAMLMELATLSVGDVFDLNSETADALLALLPRIGTKPGYWSDSLVSVLMKERLDSDSIFRKLTRNERIVLGLIGDGCDDSVASELMGIAESSVGKLRANLHGKLGAHHRIDLMRLAGDHGFVIRTRFGVIRPGWFRLMAQRSATPERRSRLKSVA